MNDNRPTPEVVAEWRTYVELQPSCASDYLRDIVKRLCNECLELRTELDLAQAEGDALGERLAEAEAKLAILPTRKVF